MQWVPTLLDEWSSDMTLSEDELSFIVGKLNDFSDQVATSLEKEQLWLPEDEELSAYPNGTAPIELWCEGFMRGIMLFDEAWFGVRDTNVLNEVEGMLGVVMAGAFFRTDAVASEHEADGNVEELVQMVPEAVLALYEIALSGDYDDVRLRADGGRSPVVIGPKVGRNEPCPCGSGMKYKKCCLGKDTRIH